MVICDEGHKLRNSETRNYASIIQLEANVCWLLTATPIMNTAMESDSLTSMFAGIKAPNVYSLGYPRWSTDPVAAMQESAHRGRGYHSMS